MHNNSRMYSSLRHKILGPRRIKPEKLKHLQLEIGLVTQGHFWLVSQPCLMELVRLSAGTSSLKDSDELDRMPVESNFIANGHCSKGTP